jgi:CheY-like chemotaxis protein
VLQAGETILLVEDEEGVRKLTRHLLELSGYRVLEAAGGEQALEIVAHHQGRIDLLVTDVVMPGMSGPQVARAVQVVYPDIKVLFQSGYTEDTLLRHGIEESRRNFIQKPFRLADLARQIRAVLDQPAGDSG